MIRYYCNKCGDEIKSNILKIATADEKNEKKNYHLCGRCATKFVRFMQIVEYDGNKVEVTEPVQEVKSGEEQSAAEDNTESSANIADANTGKPKGGRVSKYITDEVRAFIEENREDMTAKEISDKLQIPYQSVYYYMKTNKNVETEKEIRVNLSDNDVGTVVALSRAGWSIEDIAKEIGTVESNVIAALKANKM